MSTHLNQFRTATDLIAELEAEVEKFDAVGIAVGFEEGATFIFADDVARLMKLNTALAQGGQAIGLIGVNHEGGKLAVSWRLFREYKGEEWAREFLADLSDSCGQKLSQGFGTKPINQFLN